MKHDISQDYIIAVYNYFNLIAISTRFESDIPFILWRDIYRHSLYVIIGDKLRSSNTSSRDKLYSFIHEQTDIQEFVSDLHNFVDILLEVDRFKDVTDINKFIATLSEHDRNEPYSLTHSIVCNYLHNNGKPWHMDGLNKSMNDIN